MIINSDIQGTVFVYYIWNSLSHLDDQVALRLTLAVVVKEAG